MPLPQFTAFRLREIDKIMQSFNPFHLEEPLDRTASKVMNVTRLNGTILAEVYDEK
jgi:hypothetical protein